tara:strand:+ start:794 stop:1051 length:258 start_codon:yes stop_codon:yes gene_type:complete
MTTAQQKAFEEWWPDTQQDQIWIKPSDAHAAGWQAAIEWMSGELVKPNAVRAARETFFQEWVKHDGTAKNRMRSTIKAAIEATKK